MTSVTTNTGHTDMQVSLWHAALTSLNIHSEWFSWITWCLFFFLNFFLRSWMLSLGYHAWKASIPQLHVTTRTLFHFILRQGITKLPRLTLRCEPLVQTIRSVTADQLIYFYFLNLLPVLHNGAANLDAHKQYMEPTVCPHCHQQGQESQAPDSWRLSSVGITSSNFSPFSSQFTL